MGALKSGLKRLAILATANRPAQAALAYGDRFAQFLMGIGAGSEVADSGEAAVFRLLRRRPAPLTVFDVGANQGQFLTAALEALADTDHRIHSFEPGKGTFALLAARHGHTPRVMLHNLAVGRSAGTATLWYDEEGSGIASLTRRDLDHLGIPFGRSEPVPVTTIDDHCHRHGVDRIDLLKLDIEGHELDALEGARGMFDRAAIGMVLFEFGGCNIDTRTYFRDFWHFFSGRGMRLQRVTPGGLLVPIDAYREVLEQFRTTNFVALS
jgi:FkbM family methyltransferase